MLAKASFYHWIRRHDPCRRMFKCIRDAITAIYPNDSREGTRRILVARCELDIGVVEGGGRARCHQEARQITRA